MKKKILILGFIIILLCIIFINVKTDKNYTNNNHNKNKGVINKKITIDLNGDYTVVLKKNEKYVELGAHAYDEDNNDLSKKIVIDNQVDTSKIGNYTVTYSIGKNIVIRRVEVIE